MLRHILKRSLPLLLLLLMQLPVRAEGDAVALLDKGRAALTDELYSVAADFFREALDSVQADQLAEANLLLVEALCASGEYNQALARLDLGRRYFREERQQAAGLYWRALADAGLDQWTDAQASLEAMPVGGQSKELSLKHDRLLITALIKNENLAAALKEVSKWEQQHGDELLPEMLMKRCRMLFAMERTDELKAGLAALVTRFPESVEAAEAIVWQARLMIEAGDGEDAEALLRPYTERKNLSPDLQAGVLIALSDALQAQGDIHAALDAMEAGSALAEDPDLQAYATVHLANMMLDVVRIEDASHMLHKWIALNPTEKDAPSILLNFAGRLLSMHQSEAAAYEYQCYLDTFGDSDGQAKAGSGRGWALLDLEKYQEAAEAFLKAASQFEAGKDQQEMVLKAADAYYAAGDYLAAKTQYQVFIDAYPEAEQRRMALYQFAECIAQLGNPGEAERELSEVEDSFPEAPVAVRAALRRARLREESGRWKDAVARYTELIERYPESPLVQQALYSRGLAQYRNGDFSLALADFEKVVKDYDVGAFAEQSFYMRGWALYLLGRTDDALKVCSGFIVKYPDSLWKPDVLFWMAEYHYNRGELAEAEALFTQVAEQGGGGKLADQALFWAGRSASAQKEFRRAITYYNRFAELYDGSDRLADVRFAQGEALSQLGEFAGAILAFEEVVRNFPASYLANPARGRIGDCHFTLGSDDIERYQQALNAYESLVDRDDCPKALAFQARYKAGRCREKSGLERAAQRDYMKVVYDYLDEKHPQLSTSSIWFTRAAFGAAAIEENHARWRQAVRIYERVVEANVPAASDARDRIRDIRLEHWMIL